jgi:hypothetical protein
MLVLQEMLELTALAVTADRVHHIAALTQARLVVVVLLALPVTQLASLITVQWAAQVLLAMRAEQVMRGGLVVPAITVAQAVSHFKLIRSQD